MNPEIKTKWIEALRSGKYKQARGTLLDERTGAMCCLGVLCHISGISNDVLFRYRSAIIHPDLGRELSSIDENERRVLACNNDGGDSFPEIANYIEKNL
jgi:hypothetical protein